MGNGKPHNTMKPNVITKGKSKEDIDRQLVEIHKMFDSENITGERLVTVDNGEPIEIGSVSKTIVQMV